jgi:hypothetical protein
MSFEPKINKREDFVVFSCYLFDFETFASKHKSELKIVSPTNKVTTRISRNFDHFSSFC